MGGGAGDEDDFSNDLFSGNVMMAQTHDAIVEALTRLYQGFESRSRPLREIPSQDEVYSPAKKYEWLTGTEIEASLRDSVRDFAHWILAAGHGRTGALRPTGTDRSGSYDRQRFGGAMQNYLRERHYRLAHVTPQGLIKLIAEEGAALARQREIEAREEELRKKPKAVTQVTLGHVMGAVAINKFVDKAESKGSGFVSRRNKGRHYHPAQEQVNDLEQLRFYALYQQAVKGPCTQPEPPAHEADAVEKWKAHKSLGGMGRAQAEQHYEDRLKLTPTCLLLDKIYDDAFNPRSDVADRSSLCTFATDPGVR